MQVIPGIHRPYDDYQSSYGRQINRQVVRPICARLQTLAMANEMRSEKEGDR